MTHDTLVYMVTGTAPSSQPLRRKVARSAALCVTLVALGVGGAQGEVANEDELPTYPESGVYVGVRASTINYATAAKQWIRLPPLFVSAYNRTSTLLQDRRCGPDSFGRLFPYQSEVGRSVAMHFRSTAGARAPYGFVGPFTVRTVAFGSIPVEASVQLRQTRDASDKPVGLELKAFERDYCLGQGPFKAELTTVVTGAEGIGELELAVTELRVDGVDLALGSRCQTSKPATLALSSTEYLVVGKSSQTLGRFYVGEGSGWRQLTEREKPLPEGGNLFTSPVFNVSTGGLLTGNVDIPPFAACFTEDGEDISKLLTKTVAGADNPVIVRAEGLDSPSPPDPLPGLPFPTAAP